MKIIITNTVCLNTGDAAILFGIVKILKRVFGDDVDLRIYDSQADISKKYYRDLNFRQSFFFRRKGPRKLLKALLFFDGFRILIGTFLLCKINSGISNFFLSQNEKEGILTYKDADYIISTGGTYLIEKYSLIPRILDYLIVILLKKPLIFFTQSIGPFSHVDNKFSLKKIFNYSNLILLRDDRSKRHLLEIGVVNNSIFVMPDAAFALADRAVINASTETHNGEPRPHGFKVAISVRDWQHFNSVDAECGRNNYIQSMGGIAVYLMQKYNANVTFISTCQGIPEYAFDDSQVAAEIIDSMPDDLSSCIELDRHFHSPEELVRILERYDFSISTRLHMAILSMGIGVPSLPIAYEFKTKELYKRIGQERWLVDIENISIDSFISKVDNFIDYVFQHRKDLMAGVLREIERIAEIEKALQDTASVTKKL